VHILKGAEIVYFVFPFALRSQIFRFIPAVSPATFHFKFQVLPESARRALPANEVGGGNREEARYLSNAN
jgi:hypothetical protein